MNIVLRELRAYFKSLLIWSTIIILFIVVGVSKFSAFANNPEMLAILDAYPPAVLDALNLRAFNLTTITGFFGVMHVYYTLLAGVAAAMWGSDIIAKEERDKTVDFILTLPITRQRLITAKTVAAIINCAVLVLLIWVASRLAAAPYNPDAEFYRFLALQMQSIFILMLIFLAIGIFLGCALRRYKRVTAIAVALLLSTFFMSSLSDMDERLDFLKYVSPFKYVDAGMLYREGRIEGIYWVLTLLLILVSMTAAYVTYTRRDIYA
ncbi:MAG: ABC transporter permease subunit [Anaerolineae bacterium]|nr:ABC transporter permease [Caldilineales bacterium]MCX7852777.1 ABC transporter permease [Caldilineales bacterium]MDW8269459.1 ABC transporter permease subunit [Anaerolineae bacterium]